MSLSKLLFVLIGVFFISTALSYFFIKIAQRNNLVDIPNERSSHKIPTPRGGGLAIVFPALSYMLWIGFEKTNILINFLFLGGTAFLIAIVALIDDIKGVGTAIRAGLYFLSACILVFFIDWFPGFDYLGWSLIIFTILCITWMANLYNFMDGADAIAAIQALIVTLPMGFILSMSGHNEIAMLCFVIFAATSGFLVWNWPPAKIFMGDVGSCVLGFVFGGLIFISNVLNLVSIYIWLILLSLFIVDATLTLIKRILTGEKWYRAHCSHAYQRYLQIGNSHSQLASKFLVFGITVLWPLTFVANKYPDKSLLITIFIYVSLSAIWYFIQNSYNKFLAND